MNTRVTHGYPPEYKSSRWLAWQQLAPYWTDYTCHDSFHTSAQVKVLENVLTNLPPGTNARPSLVDLGCGTGHFLNLVRSRRPPHWKRLAGLDFCPDMLKLARRTDVSGFPKLEFYEADIELPIGSTIASELHNFDVATATFLLDEVEDIDSCFASAASMVRPGGHFTCGTLDYEREVQRYDIEIESARKEDAPFLISRTLPGHSSLGEFFRVVRHTHQIDRHAERHGFRLIENVVLSPSDLRSRSDGPGLRLLSWQKTEK